MFYLNYDSEFGIDFHLHHKNSTMKEEIKKFIKEKKIHFDGEKIALSFGGIVLAMLLMIETPVSDDSIQLTYVNDHIIPNEIVKNITPPNVIEDVNNNSSNHSNTVNKPSTDNINSSQNNINYNQTSSSSTPSVNHSATSEEKVEEPIVNDRQVTIYRTNGQVITLSLEEYLIGVVGAEMPASFPIEALKAQAVVARTYALKKIESGGKLTDSVSTQSYKDSSELKQLWGTSYNTYYQKVKNAVESTKDLAIYYEGKLIDAVYHSTSNGYTEDAIYVWGNNIPYLKSVDSSWDKEASSYLREVSKDFNNVLNLLGIDIRDDISFEILSRDSSGRVLEVRVGNQTFSGVEFRTLLGLRSADFDLSLENGSLIITTRGYGHGVGMSQYGASGMAKKGYNFEQILKHYYSGVDIY